MKNGHRTSSQAVKSGIDPNFLTSPGYGFSAMSSQ